MYQGDKMECTSYFVYSVITLLILLQIDAAPSRHNADRETANRKALSEYQKQLEDEDVRELKNLKSSPGSSISATKVQKTFYTNENGKKEQSVELTEQINKNGELIERVQQNVNTKQNSESEKPKTHVIGEIEIPSKGVHKVYEEDVQREIIKKKYDFRRQSANNKLNDNLVQTLRMKNVVRYQPEEMAEYIYETGDEKTVTMAIENYLQIGMLSREEALIYLQQIKAILNMLEEQEMRDKKQEQRHFLENLYGNSKNKMDVNQALSDLRDIQQLIQDKYLKQFPDDENIDRLNFRYARNQEDFDNEENDVFDSEIEKEEYRNLAGKLQNFENLFAKASMEGVIYQLAKVLFYQSFSMNGFEAQESIKQFTTFLEKQVEEGHISRNMERKVFDILLTALTDTLNEHPELVGEKDIEYNQKTNSNRKNATDSFIYKTVEKKNSQPKILTHEPAKSISLKSSGILDDPKKQEMTN